MQGNVTTLTRNSEQAVLTSIMLILVLVKKISVTSHTVCATVLVFSHGAKNVPHNNVP
jgi:hypothetical protein